MVQSLKLQGIANEISFLDTNYTQCIHQSVSIVIPYYNRPTALKQTLFSIMRVDYCLEKLEILIVYISLFARVVTVIEDISILPCKREKFAYNTAKVQI